MSNPGLGFRTRDPQLRVFLGGLAAWLFPSYAIPLGVQVFVALAGQGIWLHTVTGLLLTLLLLPITGLIVGIPTLFAGFLGWFLLHRRGLRGIGPAAVLGALAPLASIGAVSLYGGWPHYNGPFSGDTGAILLGFLILLGAVTGLLVRWVAYPAAERAVQTVDRTPATPQDAVS